MNEILALKTLNRIMGWDDNKATEEFKWLRFFSKYKYDSYRDFLAGARFIESLAIWLQQFESVDRREAYNYIKENLVYISTAEMLRLIDKLYPEIIQELLVDAVCVSLDIPKYRLWANEIAINELKWQNRKTLYMGLSDGAKIDDLRRANEGLILNEQVVGGYQIDSGKWKSLVKDLRNDLAAIKPGNGAGDGFKRIVLIDDFTASGTSLIRRDPDSNKWAGKLKRFYESLENAKKDLTPECILVDSDWKLYVHHYVSTQAAKQTIEEKYSDAVKEMSGWNKECYFSMSLYLSEEISLNPKGVNPFVDICKKYYNATIEKNRHAGQSGNPDMTFGYGQCALPLVLEHNTPNNSLPLLWAETDSTDGSHAVRPLFRRRERHAD